MVPGTSYLLVRCAYTLETTATLRQETTFYNPGASNIEIFSAQGENCASTSSPTTIISDNAFRATSTITMTISSSSRAVTRSNGADPRVCLYAKCVSGSCSANIYVDNYKGILVTSAAPSTTGSVIGSVIGAIFLVCLGLGCFLCLRQQRAKRMQAMQQVMGQPQMVAVPMGQPIPYGAQPMMGQPMPYGAQPMMGKPMPYGAQPMMGQPMPYGAQPMMGQPMPYGAQPMMGQPMPYGAQPMGYGGQPMMVVR